MQVLGKDHFNNMLDKLEENAQDANDRAELCWIRALSDDSESLDSFVALAEREAPSRIRRLAATHLLRSFHHALATTVLHELIATDWQEAPAAAKALLEVDEARNFDWQLLDDTALMPDNSNASQAICTLLQGGRIEVALPAALHLLSICQYPYQLQTIAESLVAEGLTDLGCAVAKWLALRPGSHRLAACEVLLEAGRIEEVIPLLRILAHEDYGNVSQQACQRLLILRESEVVLPILYKARNSASPELQYQANLALALSQHIPSEVEQDTDMEHRLKGPSQWERTQFSQESVEQFIRHGQESLNCINVSNDYTDSIKRLGTASLLWLAVLEQSKKFDNIKFQALDESSSNAVRLNAVLFNLRIGLIDKAQEILTELLDRDISKDLSLPVQLQIFKIAGKIYLPITKIYSLQALTDDKVEVRCAAAAALGKLCDPSAMPVLLESLKDEDDEVRCAAAAALGELCDPSAMPALLESLKDEDRLVRRASVQALGELRDPSAMPALLESLKDEDDGIRCAAAAALGKLRDPSAMLALLESLKDEDRLVRRASVQALGELRDPSAMPALLESLKDEDRLVRRAAADALRELCDPSAMPVLLESLKDEDDEVRRVAAFALRELRDPLAMPALLESLDDNDKSVRFISAFARGELRDASATPLLLKSLKDEDKLIRFISAFALGELRDPSATPFLLESLKDEDDGVRSASARALGELRDPSAIPALLESLRDEDFWVRFISAFALGELRDPAAVSPLLASVIDSPIYLMFPLARALGRLTAIQAVPLLVAAAQPNRMYVAAIAHLDSNCALEVLVRFQSQLHDQSWAKRLQGQIFWLQDKHNEALTCFQQAIQHEDHIANLLALAHFQFEHNELDEAKRWVNRALEQNSEHGIALLSRGILLWHTDETEASLACLHKCFQLGQHPVALHHLTDDLRFDHFWREKALSTLEEMLNAWRDDT